MNYEFLLTFGGAVLLLLPLLLWGAHREARRRQLEEDSATPDRTLAKLREINLDDIFADADEDRFPRNHIADSDRPMLDAAFPSHIERAMRWKPSGSDRAEA